MKYFVTLPEQIYSFLENHGISQQEIRYTAKADLAPDGGFSDSYLALSPQTLCLVTADSSGSLKLETIPLSEVEDIWIERLVNTARLLIKQNGRERALCRFASGGIRIMDRFRDRVMKLKRQEPIDDSRLDDEEIRCPKCGLPYPDQRRKVCPKCNGRFGVVRRLLSIYMEYKWYGLAMLAGILISTGFSFVTPYVGNQLLLDEVLAAGGQFYGQVLWIVLLMLGIRLFGVALSMAYGCLSAHIAPRMYRNLRLKVFEAMQRQSLDYFTNRQTGSLITRINDDTWTIYVFFVDMVQLVVVNTVTIAGLLGILFSMQSLLALLVTVFTLITTLIMRYFIGRHRKYFKKSNNAVRKLRSITSDVFNGQRVVKAFAKENTEISRFASANQRLFDSEFAQAKHSNRYFPFVRFLTKTGFSSLFFIGAVLVVSGYNLTLGALTAFVAYADMLQGPVDFFLNFSQWWSGCVDASSRIFEVLDSKPKIQDLPNVKSVAVLKGDISLKNVSFEYDVGRPILKNVSFDIPHGTMFGIVGKTGAGKSTIINLITRMYDVNEGSISIDGTDVRELRNEDLRRNIGIVSQETYLFIGTVADNIRYGRPEASIEDVIRAAKAAFAHEFIMKLPDGYQTRVGSGGVSLSGGERQRISIARAMLQKPPILILDEATAAMDTQTERRIQYAIDCLKQGRTIIAIAHRLSTLRDADFIACIDDGMLVELGTHEELIRKKGVYFELHRLQTEAFQFVEMGE